ncbi:hypothetical protein [Tunicatimonas pelagia]|uniref:hypothetical protein n=1 Tax=Tunicatimonas pelagia TaxID=931531 RepID=UPI002664F1F2|nr:hypothetical protein [Tunicatimonas pelagia]WKN45631.1 hypothetical protein P0M28_11750 [Tunicatimonas pelagia]
MKRVYFGLLWLVLIQAPILGKAQGVGTMLQNYASKSATEEVFLQLSETAVGVGDTIWFQASINQPDTAQNPSRVVYIELFNQQKVAVAQGIYQASLGVATGQLSLPDSLVGGWYQLRAYTQHMQNRHSSNFFTQPILVVNVNATNPSPATRPNPPSFTLHPEGGNWVADKKTNVVAQLYSSANHTDTIRLEIIQASDSAVVAQATFSHRLAKLSYTPQADTSYMARLITADTSYTQLPNAKPDDCTLRVSSDGNQLKIDVTKQPSIREVFLAIRSGKQLLHAQAVNQPSFSTSVPTSQVPGLIEVVLLDNQAQVLAQRLFYIDEPTSSSSISLSKTTVSPREELHVSLSDIPNLNEVTLALTVRKTHLSQHPLSVAVLNNFGLAGVSLPTDLPASQTSAWVNQWLVTQKSSWRSWPKMLSQEDSSERFIAEDEMLLITGSVHTSQPIGEDDQVLLSIPGDDPYFEYSEITEGGRFAIPISRVYGSQNSILQYNSATDEQPQSIRWKVDSTFASSPPAKFYAPYTITNDEWQKLVNEYRTRKSIQQGYYYFEDNAEDTLGQSRKQFRFYGAPNVQIDPEDYIALPSFEEICRELLPGVRLMKKKKVYDFDVFNPTSRKFLPNEPTLLLDGVPIQDKDYIINFPPDQIDFIETVNRRTYYGNVRLDGVIALYTKQEKAYEDALAGRAHFTTLPYYTPLVSFSSPDSLIASLPDFRTLLHWKPNVTLDTDETGSLSFTTSDELGQYEAVLQGVTKEGEVIYEIATFEVKPADLP